MALIEPLGVEAPVLRHPVTWVPWQGRRLWTYQPTNHAISAATVWLVPGRALRCSTARQIVPLRDDEQVSRIVHLVMAGPKNAATNQSRDDSAAGWSPRQWRSWRKAAATA